PLFCTLAGTPLYPQQVRTTLTRLAERAGIDKRVHPHGLRHAHAAHLDRSGVPITTIVRQLGHANLAVTSRYLQSLGQEEHLARVQTINWQSRRRPPPGRVGSRLYAWRKSWSGWAT